MKKLNNFITEKLKLNKDININDIHIDELNDQNTLLYDSEDQGEEEGDNDIFFEDFKHIIDDINNNNKFEGFFCCKFNSLSKIYGKSEDIIEKTLYQIDISLKDIVDKIITGKDLGYKCRIKGGHIEIDCINSGSRATYYIYAINKEGYDKLCLWWEGDEDVKTIDFLYEEGTIEEIKI